MLKVVHLDTGKELRGGQRQLLMLACSPSGRSCEQLIVCPERSALAHEAAKAKLEIFTIPSSRDLSWRALTDLRRVVKSRGFKILHAHDGRAQTISWLATLGLPVKRVASRRVTYLPRWRATHRAKYGYTCDGIIAVSRYVRDLLAGCGIPADLIEVIPDGVAIPEKIDDGARRALRRSWDLNDSDFVIGHAGAFTKEKGQGDLLRAFRLVRHSLPHARLILAGEGLMRKSLEAQYGGDAVRFLGRVEHISSLMNCLDLFVMPSLEEGLGSSALVAMAHGVPVIASHVGGLPEIVENGKTGWLIPPGDPAALAAIITNAAAQPDRRQATGEAGRQRSFMFTDVIMERRIINFYRRLEQRPDRELIRGKSRRIPHSI